ncbi:MAG: B12-binding domain-containing protein [Anaerolineae bacterium]
MTEEKNYLAEALAELREARMKELVTQKLAEGVEPLAIIEECREGMDIVGQRYETGQYFLSHLIMAAHIFSQAMVVLEPELLSGQRQEPLGVVVCGTVKGDIHSIGKNIVVALLRSQGFEVHDLGEDVPAAAFVQKTRETGAQVIGLSGLMTIAYDSMKETVEALKEAGLRDKIKVMIGGAFVDEQIRAHSGADAFGNSATDAVRLCHRFLGRD